MVTTSRFFSKLQELRRITRSSSPPVPIRIGLHRQSCQAPNRYKIHKINNIRLAELLSKVAIVGSRDRISSADPRSGSFSDSLKHL